MRKCPIPKLSMEESKQLELIRHFMVAVAPEVTRHQFTQLRHHQITLPMDEEGLIDYSEPARSNAKITLELAMHLAAQYASCYDSLKSEEVRPPPSQDDNPPPEPVPRQATPRVRRPGEDIPS
jgi:hypothetical protein